MRPHVCRFVLKSFRSGLKAFFAAGKRWPRILSLLFGELFLIFASASMIAAEESVKLAEYKRTALPVLKTYCGDCHGADNSDGRWAFDVNGTDTGALADQASWRKVRQLVKYHLMPPQGESAPTSNNRRVILDWIDNSVFYVDPTRPAPGAFVLRRLNRAEYNNTVRGRIRHFLPAGRPVSRRRCRIRFR